MSSIDHKKIRFKFKTMALNGDPIPMDLQSRISAPKLLSVKPIGENGFESRPSVVVVRNATKNYGKCSVIEGLNMTIKQGTIYSFLGSSGCGKSTTLECIVGLRKFASGKVLVFGKEPGSHDSDVPGKAVGYMPQDYSLYNKLSVEEILIYFGTMNGMNGFEISKELMFYNDLLNLPKYSSPIESLSGGQKRRVSLVAALVHKPPLVILDEPTVGMDPLLCQNVLSHLTQLARTRGTTVLITTHYIEGARRSDIVGVMRNGKLIAEKSPQKLLSDYQETSLESVVLKLCKEDDGHTESNTFSNHEVTQDTAELYPEDFPASNYFCKTQKLKDSLARTRALVKKNFFTWRRTLFLVFISILFPSVGFIPIYYCYSDPNHVRFGVVNMELNGTEICDNFVESWNRTCDLSLWSCKYLSQLEKNEFILYPYNSPEEAEMGVHLGEIWGFILFHSNFTDELFQRAITGTVAESNELSSPGSNIVIRLDKSNKILAYVTEFRMFTGFSKFLKEIFDDCDLNSKKIEYSLEFKEPILGKGLTFSDFVTPPHFVVQMLFLPIVSTGLQFVADKRDKTMQRAVVAGAHLWEIFLSFAITETGVSILRLLAIYGTVKFLGVNLLGSPLLEAALVLLVGLMGTMLGFLFGLFCRDEVQVSVLVLGIYFPNFFLSGAIWPLEGLSDVLRKIAYFLPLTLPSTAMRSMCARGWGLESWDVQLGFITGFSYLLVVFLSLILVSNRYKPW